MAMSKHYECVLGGLSPGVYKVNGGIAVISRPSYDPTHPPFPLTVVCRSREQAAAIASIQPIIEAHEHITDSDDLLYALLQTDEVRAVLPNQNKFYGVIFGIVPTGIYLEYSDIDAVFRKEPRKLRRLDTFQDALTYMLTQGRVTEGRAFWTEYRRQGPGDRSLPRSSTIVLPPSSSTPVRKAVSPQPDPPIRRTISSQASSSRQLVSQSPPISRSQSIAGDQPNVRVYQYIRNLSGVVRTVEKPPSIPAEDDETIPKLGRLTDRYLSTHGYTVGSIHRIEHAADIHQTSQAFINYLHSYGMAWTEAEFVWELLQLDME